MIQKNREGISLYIHIPFCRRKCHYCDFVSFIADRAELKRYISYLKKETEIFFSRFSVGEIPVKTLYIGGGTPSLMESEDLGDLLDFLSKSFNLFPLYEFTIEANPETLDLLKFEEFKAIGVNRVSMGAQSFNDRTLNILGRIHNAHRIYEGFEVLRRAGFDNINIDLMFNLPEERVEDTLSSLRKAIELSPEHISYYSLTIEEGTFFYDIKDSLYLPAEAEEVREYKQGIALLKKSGYHQYEISNFASEGKRCLHNIAYWESLPYLGLGVSAGSFIGGERTRNVSNLSLYYDKLCHHEMPYELREKLTGVKLKGEYIMMSLRLLEGVNNLSYYNKFGVFPEEDFADEIAYLKEYKFLSVDKYGFRFTKRGILLANEVMTFFI